MNWDDCSRDQVARPYCDERDATFYLRWPEIKPFRTSTRRLRVVSAAIVWGGELSIIDKAGMFALGHKQTFPSTITMSAFTAEADMCGAARDVRFGPIADSS
jgi:hypothetical protein